MAWPWAGASDGADRGGRGSGGGPEGCQVRQGPIPVGAVAAALVADALRQLRQQAQLQQWVQHRQKEAKAREG